MGSCCTSKKQEIFQADEPKQQPNQQNNTQPSKKPEIKPKESANPLKETEENNKLEETKFEDSVTQNANKNHSVQKPNAEKQQNESSHVENIEQVNFTATNFIIRQTGKLRTNYKVQEVLGDGSFGKVRKAIHKSTGDKRAIKTITKESVQSSEGGEQRFFAEVDILRRLDHPNILKLYEFYEDERHYHLITELCTGGELFDRIIDKGKFNEQIAAQVMHQVFSAVNYCHKNQIVHRDLKPENLLLETNAEDANIKIIDFGTSQFFDPNKKMNKTYGTPYYIAPEVIKKSYNEKCDVWSCGVILYILLCGCPPFSGPNDTIIMKNVAKGKYSFESHV